jgi:hypothetical protein
MTCVEINEAWIVGVVRTPIGRHGDVLSSVRPDDLGAITLVALIQRTGVPPEEVEDVYMGCANQVRDDSSSPPFKEIMQSFIKHLHAFVSQVGSTGKEWFRAIDFLTRTGHVSDDKRQEFILPPTPWVYRRWLTGSTTRSRCTQKRSWSGTSASPTETRGSSGARAARGRVVEGE